MDNDNKINEENLSLKDRNKIHQEVMLFLGDELENIHKSSKGQTYDIEKEYGKTKKNKSPFVALILTGCFVVVIDLWPRVAPLKFPVINLSSSLSFLGFHICQSAF